MSSTRRSFLLAAAATATTAAAAKAAAAAAGTDPGVVPAWEAPLFNLPQFSKAPIRVKSIELLKSGKTYFVRTTSTDGVVGLVRTKQVEDSIDVLRNRVIPFFLGRDIRDLEALIDEIYIRNYKLAGQLFWSPVAFVEQSLFDLFGKTVGKPVGELLGGVKRRSISVYLSGSIRETTAEQEVEVYRQGMQATGAHAVKFKIGGRMSRNADQTPGRTEKMMTLARKTLGDAAVLYVDANGSYNAAKAIEIGRWLEELKVAFYEEPCPWEEMSETKTVADALRIPIAFGECDSSFWKFDHMIRTRALDIVQPDLNDNGGFIRAARVARMARAAGLPITPHNTQTGAAAVNIVQFASAIPNIGPYMEFPWRGQHDNEPWFAPHFIVKEGALAVPANPGLGIEIDPKFLARCERVLY